MKTLQTLHLTLRHAALTCAGCALSSLSLAQSALVHVQGEPGSREAYYANFAVVLDRTPAEQMLGPTDVRQLETVIVYESADKPEFAALRLQFECTVKYPFDGKTIPKQPAFDAPVKVRVGEGSWKLRREDLKSEPLPAAAWRSSNSAVLLKLHKIACNEEVMRSAMVKAAKRNNDVAVFRSEIKTIGLPEDLQLIGQQTAPEYLDFSWWVLWNGAKRPDPSGKWSSRPTRQELEQAKAQIAQYQQQVDQLAGIQRPKLERGIQQSEEEFNFQKLAASIRGDRKLSRSERLMLTAWENKSETDIGAVLGAPAIASAGNLRFLSYGRENDNRVLVGNRAGAVWEAGFYENCNVQFVLHADAKDRMRVVDVRVWGSATGIGSVAYACSDLMEAPR